MPIMTGRSHSRNRKAQKRRQPANERRLIVGASVVIVVAAASIGGMLALQYRGSETISAPDRPHVSGTEEATHEAPPQLPLYEEPLEPAAVAPLPPEPRDTGHSARPTPAAPPDLAGGVPAWRRYAVAIPPETSPRPRIAIVVDDLGVDRKRSDRAVALPAPLTVAFLPYAHDLAQQTAAAHRAGHELLVHMPMDPRNRKITDPGPNALLVDLDANELRRRIVWNLSRFSGFVGVNNHMGSRFTANADVTSVVMAELRRRGLLFLDSRTSAASVALAEARSNGVPAVARDVFIDNERTPEAVRAALAHVEEVARKNGHAVAIGHPHDVTIDALAAWLPDVVRRGFELVPISALVRYQATGG